MPRYLFQLFSKKESGDLGEMDDSRVGAGTRQDETEESENIRKQARAETQHNKAATPTPTRGYVEGAQPSNERPPSAQSGNTANDKTN